MNRIKWFFRNFRALHVLIATKILINALKKDRGLYRAYHANIAVCFQDEMKSINGFKTVGKLNWPLISNAAAKRFMDIWTK